MVDDGFGQSILFRFFFGKYEGHDFFEEVFDLVWCVKFAQVELRAEEGVEGWVEGEHGFLVFGAAEAAEGHKLCDSDGHLGLVVVVFVDFWEFKV